MNKTFLVTIISGKKTRQSLKVIAENKKEAKEMTCDFLIKSNCFEYTKKEDFKLKCKKIKSSV